MSRHSLTAAAVVAALALPLTALGTERATAPQYRAQANAICAKEEKTLQALPSSITLPGYLVEAVKIAHTAFDSLASLVPPPALSRLHAEVIANIEAGFPIVKILVARAKAGKLTIPQFEDYPALVANAAKENALWKKLGANTCVSV
jgi:hypothetical protein